MEAATVAPVAVAAPLTGRFECLKDCLRTSGSDSRLGESLTAATHGWIKDAFADPSLALEKEEAEEGQQLSAQKLSAQQLCEFSRILERADTDGGQRERLDVFQAAKNSTSEASRELMEVFEATEMLRTINDDIEARKVALEERTHVLEERLELLETRGAHPPEHAALDASTEFALCTSENEDHARMIQMAEAKRIQLEDRTREIELQMERLEQIRQQDLQETSEGAGRVTLMARIAQLEVALLEKDQQVQQHLHHLEDEKRSEAQRLLARTAQLEVVCAEKEQQVEELRARLEELASPQANACEGGVNENDLQAILMSVAEVHGRAQLQAAQVPDVARLFEQHATELHQLRQVSGAAPHEVDSLAPGELHCLQVEAAATSPEDAETARAEKQALNEQLTDAQAKMELLHAATSIEGQRVERMESLLMGTEDASLQRAADAEARARELEDALTAKEEFVSQILQDVAEKDQEIIKLAQALDLQQRSAMADAPQYQSDDMEEFCQRASLAEAKVAELTTFIQEQKEQTVQLSATVAAMEQEIVSLRSVQLPPDVEELVVWARGAEAREAELRASIGECEAERSQLSAGVTAMEQEIIQLQAEVITQTERGRDVTLARAHEELTNRVTHAEARAKEFEELAIKRGKELTLLTSAGTEQELANSLTHAEARAKEFEELAIKREDKATLLEAKVAGTERELTNRATHAEARAKEFEELAIKREDELTLLEDKVAGTEQELTNRATHAEARATEFEELARKRGEALTCLEATVAQTERDLTHRMTHADKRATEAEELAIRREEELSRLKATVAEMVQELTCKKNHESRATEFEELARRREAELFQLQEKVAGIEQELTHRTTRADMAAELEEQAIRREEEVTRLKDTAAGLERELVLHRSLHLESANQVASLQAQLQRMKGVEADALAAQARMQEKDMYISQLKQDVSSLEQELAHLQAQEAEAHEVSKQSLMQQMALTEAHMQTAKTAEETAAHFSTLADQKARHVERLEMSASKLQCELVQLRAAAAERAGADEAGRWGLLLQARAMEDIAGGEGLQEKADEVHAREDQRAKRFEEEKASLQRQLEAQFEVEYAAIRKEAADAQKGFEALCLESEALKSQLEQVQASETQRAKLFEKEKAALRRNLAEQFETEYSVIHKKATDAERELRNLFQERDALKKKLEQAHAEQQSGAVGCAGEQELRPAVAERLTCMEAEEAKAKLQVVEQELLVAYQTIERQSQEHAQLHSRRSHAQQLEVKLAHMEQDKLALQEQLVQRTKAYNRELDDVTSKMKLLEDALITAGGNTSSSAQAPFEQLTMATWLHAAEDFRRVGLDSQATPTCSMSRPGFGDGLQGAVQYPAEVPPVLNTIPSIQVTLPPQQHRPPVEAPQSPQLVAATATSGPFAGHGFASGKQPQSPIASLSVPMPTMMSPMSSMSHVASYAAPPQTAAMQASAAPLQSLVLPGGIASPIRVHAQEPLGAGPAHATAAWQMRSTPPLVSPVQPRPQEPNSPAATAVVLQRAASPEMQRPVQSMAATAAPVFEMQAAAVKPIGRTLTAAQPAGVVVAALEVPRAGQPVMQPLPLQGRPATFRHQLSDKRVMVRALAPEPADTTIGRERIPQSADG